MSFAANQLAKVWLPEEVPSQEVANIREIRLSIRHAIKLAPWKFKLWRAALRAAVRRPHGVVKDADHHQKATAWLESMIQWIAVDGKWSEERNWPEAVSDKDGFDKRRPFLLSALRTEFWRALAETLLDLDRLRRVLRSQNPLDYWRAEDWTFRAIPEGEVEGLIAWLGDVDGWAAKMYDTPEGPVYALEREAYELARLAGQQQTKQAAFGIDWSMPKGSSIHDTHFPNSWSDTWLALIYMQRGTGSALPLPAKVKVQDRLHILAALGRLGEVTPDDLPKTLMAPSVVSLFTKLKSTPWEVRLRLHRYARVRSAMLSCGASQSTHGSKRLTLHQLLWSSAPEDAPQPWNCPRVGLPIRIAMKMLLESLAWPTSLGKQIKPPVWVIREQVEGALLAGRSSLCSKLDQHAESGVAELPLDLIKIAHWGKEIPPHPLFLALLAHAHDKVDHELAVTAIHILLFFTAIEGAETLADRLFELGPGATPFAERWELRHRIHLPQKVWQGIEQLLLRALTAWGHAGKTLDVELLKENLITTLDECLGNAVISTDDFRVERVDVVLKRDALDDLPREISTLGVTPPSTIEFKLQPDELSKTMGVRVAQLASDYGLPALVNHKLRLSRQERQRIMAEVRHLLVGLPPKVAAQSDTEDINLVVFPEAAIPWEEEKGFRCLIERTGRAALAGLTWRVIPPAKGKHPKTRWFANQALFLVPVETTAKDRLYRSFTITKPLPAHVEQSFARVLTSRYKQSWRILPGNRWYRFVHPKWGDFTIAICSDLLDPAPWASLRGEVMHLFQCAYNEDVELFLSLTWVRGYETYVNVVSVNHGHKGGSYVWTPKNKHYKTIARFEGEGLSLAADTRLPVEALYVQQQNGVKQAEERGKSLFTGKKKAEKDSEFKAPPPGYKRR